MDFRKKILARVKIASGCDQCEALMINGVFCHEHGCPNAWVGRKKKCFECGFDFTPENKNDSVCPDCIHAMENPEVFASWKSYLIKKADEVIAPVTPVSQFTPLGPRQKIPYEVWIKSKKSDGTTYEQWAKRVDRLVGKKYGLGMDDFPDWRSMDAYESNKTAEQGFRAFMRAQKGEFGDMMY